jgi:hypothetical protein
MPVIGFLSSRSPGESADVVAAFRRGLQEAGFVEGQNLVIAFRWAEGRYNRLPALAADLADLRVAVLFAAGGPPSALAAKAATSTIPIIFSAANDPVRLGRVTSLNRPGGNVTGMSTFIGAREEICWTSGGIGAEDYGDDSSRQSINPTSEIESQEAQTAANALGIELHIFNAATEQELDAAFAALVNLRAQALVVSGEPFFDTPDQILWGRTAPDRRLLALRGPAEGREASARQYWRSGHKASCATPLKEHLLPIASIGWAHQGGTVFLRSAAAGAGNAPRAEQRIILFTSYPFYRFRLWSPRMKHRRALGVAVAAAALLALSAAVLLALSGVWFSVGDAVPI